MQFKSIVRLPLSPTLSLASLRHFFFSTSGPSSATPPKALETISMNINKVSSKDISDQKPTSNQASCIRKLSHQAQSAIWAERVIHYILNAKPLTDIHSNSLREQIMKLQNPDKQHQFDVEPKQKVMQLFTQGVRLDSLVFDQQRISASKQTFQQSQNQEKSFIFCPNLLVTKEIFKIMMALSPNFLMTGGFGISKTVSVILFIQLSNHINSYLFKAAQPQHNQYKEELIYLKSLQHNPFFFDQETQDKQLEHWKLQLSEQKKYFSTKIPRCWYWSIRPEELQIESALRQILLSQASQITQQKKDQLRYVKNFYQFIRQLKRCYPPFLLYRMKVVVDQFNAVASLARTWNKKFDQYKSMSEQKINNDAYEKDKRENKLCAQEIIRIFKDAIYLSNSNRPSFVLNSSMSIQRELLEKGQQSEKVYFNIKNQHGDLSTKEIRYLQELNGSLIDFLHNFWFQIERKLKIRNNDNVAITEMKNKFLEEVKDKQVNYFSRFLYVREYLTQQKIIQIQNKYNEFKKQGTKQNPFKGIYEQFTEKSKMNYKQNIRKFFLKDNTDCSFALLYSLFDMAVLQSITTDKHKELTIKLKDLEGRIGQDPLIVLNLDTYKEILPFTFTQDKKFIKFYWKPEEFTSTIKEVLYETLSDQVFQPLLLTGLQRNSGFRGIYFEICIIQSLKKGGNVIFRQPLSQLNELQFNISQNRSTKFQPFNEAYLTNHEYVIKKKSQVDSDKRLNKDNRLQRSQAIAYIKKTNKGKPRDEKIPKMKMEMYCVYKVVTASLSKILKDLFAKCDQNPNQFCIAIPYYNQKYDTNSECIDFIIAKKKLHTYHIFTFDVSTSRRTSKLSDAKKFFAELVERQTEMLDYKLNHIVLCHKDVMRQVTYNPQEIINILYSPWETMTIKNSGNQKALKAFYRMIKINNITHDPEQ